MPDYESAQKDKQGWRDLISVLNEVENVQKPEFTLASLRQTLAEVYRRLGAVAVSYPLPKRVSFKQTQALIKEYLSTPSGGERPLTVMSALMQALGESFRVFAETRRGKITAADTPSGFIANIECLDENGNIVLVVEVKDKELRFNHVSTKMPAMRAKHVAEILYIAQHGVASGDKQKIADYTDSEFATGQNIYVFDNVMTFSSGILALLGENGRRRFLLCIGEHLDQYGAAIQHKTAWSELLSKV